MSLYEQSLVVFLFSLRIRLACSLPFLMGMARLMAITPLIIFIRSFISPPSPRSQSSTFLTCLEMCKQTRACESQL